MSELQPDLAPAASMGEELPAYRPVCVSAVAGFLLALAAPLALLHPVMWGLPIVAAAVCGFALHVLSRSEPMAGGGVARFGLVLSLVFAAWAPIRAYSYDFLMRRDADRFAELWFSLLRQNEPHKAFQLSQPPGERSPLDDELWAAYRARPAQRQGLEAYVQQPLVRTLLALGDRATVRRFAVQAAASDRTQDGVDAVYAVTWDDAGARKTFFVRLLMGRNLLPSEGPREWHINKADGGYRPVALGGKADR